MTTTSLRVAAVSLAIAASPSDAAYAQRQPDTVHFMSADGKTNLVGYVFKPTEKRAARAPAVVMMHGRAGAYSLNVKDKGPYNASTLSMRHKQWGKIWSDLGYVAVMVDGFGPRGYPGGFAEGSYKDRPEALNEVTVRPLDAYGSLAYLRAQPDVARDRIGLQGWSNGASATLATMATDAPGIADHSAAAGFRGALVFYAGCGLHQKYDEKGYLPYTTVLQFHGTNDKETPYKLCKELVDDSRENGGDIQLVTYRGASHSFDDPGRRRQEVDANQYARKNSIERSEKFFEGLLAKGLPPR